MPTIYTDQFFLFDPFNPPPAGTAINFTRLEITDQNDDLDFDRFDGDSVDGSDISRSFPGDVVTINVPGIGNVTYTGITFYLADGRQVFTPNDGQVLQDGVLVSTTWVSGQGPLNIPDIGPTCFTLGTMIETGKGPCRIEDIAKGDLIMTRDKGLKPVLWIGSSTFAAEGASAPVLIQKGALGNDTDMMVSQQHRMLISGWQAELYMGVDEALVAAKYLINGDTIRIVDGGEVTYFHLLFDRHEIVMAAGIPSESYHPQHAASSGDREIQAAFLKLSPNLHLDQPEGSGAARHVARQHEGCLMAA